ncbi:hypothetical protein OIU85_010814 [Salix viminalis]|uniref:Uncharacterized protein n=1 Tax=Salix viminalis TaxID=40686 RepID=A0A9Q0NRI1_SALVM|nr:hypothetical protein OIU85_010814 [Salix viminalis]
MHVGRLSFASLTVQLGLIAYQVLTFAARYPCNTAHPTGGFATSKMGLTELDSELRTLSCGGSTEESTVLNAMARLVPSQAVAPSP